jgi:hypothetical protein
MRRVAGEKYVASAPAIGDPRLKRVDAQAIDLRVRIAAVLRDQRARTRLGNHLRFAFARLKTDFIAPRAVRPGQCERGTARIGKNARFAVGITCVDDICDQPFLFEARAGHVRADRSARAAAAAIGADQKPALDVGALAVLFERNDHAICEIAMFDASRFETQRCVVVVPERFGQQAFK